MPSGSDPIPRRRRVDELEDRVRRLERIIAASSLHSESFKTRAFAVFGHYMVAYLILVLPILVLALCAGVVLGPAPASNPNTGIPSGPPYNRP